VIIWMQVNARLLCGKGHVVPAVVTQVITLVIELLVRLYCSGLIIIDP